ncbi:MAG: efflux RND transporter permease subunit, partial [Myxococcales bacterium]|nr:efflux RND transporter permease subunit [Myxococcales bacterium]
KIPAGQLRSAQNDLVIEVEGELDSLARIRAIPLRQADGGRLLRLGDVAVVDRAAREPAASEAWLSGHRGVAVSATMESNRRVDHWAAAARDVIAAYGEQVPNGVAYRILFDQSGYTQERLGTLAGNLLLGAGLVIAVLFFMMGARDALIVGSALPITVCMVLAELNFLGIPLHQTSVTGIIIALGLLIDNAIVVVDEYDLRLRRGVTRGQAVITAVTHLRVPLLASTLTTVLAFLPIVLMEGGAGEFVGPISIGVILSVASSFLIAMTLIPALAAYTTSARTLERAHAGGREHFWKDGFSSERLARAWGGFLDLVLARPWIGATLSVILPFGGFVAATTLTEQFFPPNDRNQFQIQMELPAQSATAETRASALRAREILHAHDEVLESHWFVGDSPPRVFYTMLGSSEGVPSKAGAFVTTRSPDATEALLGRLQRELIDAFPNARVVAIPFEQGPPFDAPIEVRVVGPELEELRRLGDVLRATLAETDGVTYTAARVAGGEPKLLVRADEVEARLAGLRLADIARQLNANLEGAVGGSILESTEEIPVRVRVRGDHRATLGHIFGDALLAERSAVDERGITGAPLSALGRVDLVPELAGVTRRNGERSNTIQAFLVPYTLIAESLADFRRRLDASGFALPDGYRIEFGGETEQRSEALANLVSFALPLFVLMAGTIILSFNSFRLAGIVGIVAFLSVGLAMLGVWSFGHPMGFLAIVGTMGLVGLAINGSIVVLSALEGHAEARAGDPEAIRDVVIDATRHILATTFTTIVGFLPLILFGGRFWPPLATAIAGGVLGSAVLALVLSPCLYVGMRRRDAERVARRIQRNAARREAAAAAPPPIRATG